MAPNITHINFSATVLANCYSDFYATILDDVFSAEECAELISLASTPPNQWQPAGLSTKGPTETVHSEFRNSERILIIDEDVSKKIYTKLYPLVEDIHEITPTGKWGCITGKPGRKQSPMWRMVRVNPRLSFLRYGPGHYFKPHCDGLITLDDGHEKSFVTLHIYLNEENEHGVKLKGGATRFWSPNKKEYLDVEPRIGRVLVFQQRMLVHSGEVVEEGIKYTMRSDFMFSHS